MAFHGFSLVFHGFSLIFHGFSFVFHGFSLVFHGFSLVFHGFSLVFNGFSLVFHAINHGNFPHPMAMFEHLDASFGPGERRSRRPKSRAKEESRAKVPQPERDTSDMWKTVVKSPWKKHVKNTLYYPWLGLCILDNNDYNIIIDNIIYL